MLKGKKTHIPNVIIDKNLNVIDTNTSFLNLFEENVNWQMKSIKITELVDIENLNEFKRNIENLELENKFENHFRALIKANVNLSPIIISISKIDKNHPKWSNQVVQLSCTELGSIENDDILKIIELQEQINAYIREISSIHLLISQKNRLLESIVKQIEKAIPFVNNDTRIRLQKIIKNIKSQRIFDENWENLKYHYVNINPTIFSKLRNLSPKITEKDLRHCSFIKMGFSVKETSQLLFMQPKSVEMARYRIKKKLNLKQDQNLLDFIRNL